MALIGSIEPFNPSESDIISYMERMEQLFECNEVPKEKQVAMFLTLIGGEAYNVLKDLVDPVLPSTKTYKDLKEVLSNHYCPKKLVIAERYMFYGAQQDPSEDVKSFVAKLKKLSKFCKFGNFLNDALRDKFVCGLRSENIKRKLLTEEDLSWDKAFKIAVSMELAEGQVRAMGPEVDAVNKLGNSTFGNSSKQLREKQRPRRSNFSSEGKPFYRCTRKHDPESCPAKNWECYHCHKKGHTSRACRKPTVNVLVKEIKENGEPDEEDSLDLGFISEIQSENEKSFMVKLQIEGRLVDFEIDSGACKTVMHLLDYKKLFSRLKLYHVGYNLKVVTGESVKIIGEVKVTVACKNKIYCLPLVILDGSRKFMPLLGRNWLNVLKPNWKNLFHLSHVTHKDVKVVENKSEQQCTSGSEVKLARANSAEQSSNKRTHYITEIREKFAAVFSERSNSFIDKFKVELKIREGTQPIFHRAYDMPYALKEKVDLELSKMVKAGILSKVSFSNWASPIVVVPKKNSDELRICVDFKKTLNRVLDSDHCVLPLPEDIFACLSGNEYFTVIDLKGAYQQLQISKMSRELLTINTHVGLFTYNRLTYGISAAPGIFQTVMDTMLSGWSADCEKAFEESKQLLSSDKLLVHYNPKLPIYLTCDSSGYGVGAILSHRLNGEDRPILFASSTLSQAEKKYSNLEREALALIFGLRKFHKYIFARKFVLITDHQPLQFIFARNKGIPVSAAARITRWAITLSGYNYDIEYKKGKLVSNADGLSRLPMDGVTDVPDCLYSFNLINNVPLHNGDIVGALKKDNVLIKVVDMTISGWPNAIHDQQIKPYFKKRHELTVEQNCLLLGNKVVVPEALRNRILELFHEQHLGIVRTKMLLRSYCWWPGLNDDVEKFISSCEVCQQTQNFTSTNPLCSWPPAPNNFFRTVKKNLNRALFNQKGEEITENVILDKLANFLFTYRNSPSTVTGLSPAESILKNRPRTRFDLLKPNIYQTCKPTGLSTNSAKLYNVNELVYVKNAQTRLWNKGKIVKVCSHSTYLVLIENEVKFVHADSIRPRYNDVTYGGYSDSVSVTPVTMPTIKFTNSSNLNNKENQGDKVGQDNINSPTKNVTTVVTIPTSVASPQNSNECSSQTSVVTRSGRASKPPARLDL
ncbi:hypothetical protein ILUMI_17840 [Ignelater luminosus]|uniref:RNA-directed DNA polymerase n=1 Tax=Ignelater luminosus TaxID=2038154 RepID=A0A8K0CPR5_IGNLU|nr:hypothetical protein ILUMI_17840 [Ignelater luminosus]